MSWRKAVSLAVIAACILTIPVSAAPKGGKAEESKGKAANEVQVDVDSTGEATEETTAEIVREKVKDTAWKAEKDRLEAQKDMIEGTKDEMEAKFAELEADYEAAKASGDEAAIKTAQGAMAAAKAEMTGLKTQMSAIKAEMKDVIRNKYTQEELDALEQVAAEIEEADADVEVIPVENIYSKKGNFKFDVPPVIKQERTLIPVRAITEGLGAEVQWDGANQTVTVTKDGIEIIFDLKTGAVTVDGEAKTIDVPAGLINNRTMVPLRFIAEALNLKVGYDSETGVIDIDEEAGETTETTEGTDAVDTAEPVEATETAETVADTDTDAVDTAEPAESTDEEQTIVVEPVEDNTTDTEVEDTASQV
ncbi:stalk domain-containing protein [Anaerosolibacter sp.]|uniref:stalk domain-containing protein n=1 Tax=Anaerosolibacter sp. TaxID=1872527 RepID=UPI0039EED5E1